MTLKPDDKRNQNVVARLETVKQVIREYWTEHHCSPGIRDIADTLNMSTSVVKFYLRKLEDSEWLEPRHEPLGQGAAHARQIIPSEIFRDRPVFESRQP